MKNINKWKDFKFQYGDDKEFSNLSRNIKAYLKRNLQENYELINYSKGYFEISGFIRNTENNKYMYFSFPDVRYDSTWYNHVLYRTAENETDYTGGQNKYCSVENLINNMQNSIKNEEISHNKQECEFELESA